jgi:hypothetical protein
VQVVNHGPSVAKDVRLQVVMPTSVTATGSPACAAGSGICPLGTLSPGAHRTFAITLVPHQLASPRNYAVTIPARVTTTSVESTLANNTAKARLSVKQPTLRLLPSIGSPGVVTLAFGDNLPPNALVNLDWKEGITGFDGPFRVAADGTVQAQMLVLRRDDLGVRQLILTGPAGRFSPVQADMLVVPRSESPPRFLGRN